jgi:hypothetical protein
MTSGVTAAASENKSSDTSRADVIGSRSIAVIMAPMPMAMAGTAGRPGRCDSRRPPAAPRKMLGNTGPPRKVASDNP